MTVVDGLISFLCVANIAIWAAIDHAELNKEYYIVNSPPVKYVDAISEPLFSGLYELLKDMPLPTNDSVMFVRDAKGRLRVCELPVEDIDEVSPDVDDMMTVVMLPFNQKCASRAIGEWYYEVCGNLAVRRSRYVTNGYSKKTGRAKISRFRNGESLGVIGRDRRLSDHSPTLHEPRFVEQTYYDGSPCEIVGDKRTIQSTVTFECSQRFVNGYVHINNVIEEHPCKFRLQLLSSDFCAHPWLEGSIERAYKIRCRPYFHPDRLKTVLKYLKEYTVDEAKARAKRMDEWSANHVEHLANMVLMMGKDRFSEKLVTELVRTSTEQFLYHDVRSVEGELSRVSRLAHFIINELFWASIAPEVPFSEHELELREKESKLMHKENEKRWNRVRKVLERWREREIEKAMYYLDLGGEYYDRSWLRWAEMVDEMSRVELVNAIEDRKDDRKKWKGQVLNRHEKEAHDLISEEKELMYYASKWDEYYDSFGESYNQLVHAPLRIIPDGAFEVISDVIERNVEEELLREKTKKILEEMDEESMANLMDEMLDLDPSLRKLLRDSDVDTDTLLDLLSLDID